MRSADLVLFSWQVLSRHRFRTFMVLLAMAVGVASVVVLTSLGEGARRYVLEEFSALGKDVLIVFPGRKETTGGVPPVLGTAARDLTLDDAHYLGRRISAISRMAPLVVASAEVSYRQRAREVLILGSNSAFIELRQLRLSQGRNIKSRDVQRISDECIVGQTIRKELFSGQSPIGARIRVGDYRCRVVGVLAGRGDSIGMDLSDMVIMPITAAQRLFNAPGLFRLMIKVKPGYDLETVRSHVEAVMKERHRGEQDITVVSADAMLATFDGVLMALTLGVGAIAGISLLVAGILIMNVTLISISQRRAEIGLLKALGASSADVQALFLVEAMMINLIGAGLGLLGGLLLVLLGDKLMPGFPLEPPLWAAVAAILVAVSTGLAFAWMPALRASQLQPVNALQQR